MTKAIIFFCILLLAHVALFAQAERECFSPEAAAILKEQRARYPKAVDRVISQADMRVTAEGIKYIIPVIVHVVHNGEPVGEGPNISASQVYSQLYSLNRDFRGLNADTVLTYELYKPLAADTQIEFRPALFDPEGNPLEEPGIERIVGEFPTWARGSIVRDLTPKTIWDPEHYLNLWSVKYQISSSLGMAFYPETNLVDGIRNEDLGLEPGTPEADGAVVNYTAFGSNFFPFEGEPLKKVFDLGRTLTHELGHYFGLVHIWGNHIGCSHDDFVSDTPLQSSHNGGINCSLPGPDSCTDDDLPDMFQNFMDYTPDSCMTLFTEGQAARMHKVLKGATRRVSLHENAPSSPVEVALYYDDETRLIDFSWQSDSPGFIIERAAKDSTDYIIVATITDGANSATIAAPNFDVSSCYRYRVLAVSATGISSPSQTAELNVINSRSSPHIQARLYPNPANAEVTLEVPTCKPWEVQIYNSFGQMVGHWFNTNSTATITLREYTPGIYYLKIWNEEFFDTKKLVKE
jgi:hypothetical protein